MSICELTTRELVFAGHDNAITLIPLTNTLTNARMDLTGVIKVDVCIGAIKASSDDVPSYISWEEQTIETVLTWVIVIQPGMVAGIVPGEQNMRVVVYDADNLEGLVVTHDFPIEVIADC